MEINENHWESLKLNGNSWISLIKPKPSLYMNFSNSILTPKSRRASRVAAPSPRDARLDASRAICRIEWKPLWKFLIFIAHGIRGFAKSRNLSRVARRASLPRRATPLLKFMLLIQILFKFNMNFTNHYW